MPQEKLSPNRPHTVVLENREILNISAVREVKSFDEGAVSLDTDSGILEIRGTSLHIESFNTVTGDITLRGSIFAVVWRDGTRERGFLKRVFS